MIKCRTVLSLIAFIFQLIVYMFASSPKSIYSKGLGNPLGVVVEGEGKVDNNCKVSYLDN